MDVAKKNTRSKAKTKAGISILYFEIVGLILIAFAIIIFFEYGFVGRIVKSVSMFLLGNLHFALPFFMGLIALVLMIRQEKIYFKNRIVQGAIFITLSLTIFSHSVLFEELYQQNALHSTSTLKETWRILIEDEGILNRSNALGGGFVGALLFSLFHILFGGTGARVAAILLLLIGIVLITGKAFVPIIVEKLPNVKKVFAPKKRNKRSSLNKDESRRKRTKSEKDTTVDEVAVTQEEPLSPITIAVEDDEHDDDNEPIISAFTQHIQKEEVIEEVTNPLHTSTIEETIQHSVENYIENQDYLLPAMNLLNVPPEHDQSGEYSIIQANAKKLEQTLLSFGVKAKVTQVHLGPAVTKYEVMPDVGVKVSKIVSLQDDLALALAAKDIRMEAPIPGKSAIGIEVPNSEIAIVTLREVLEAKENNKPDSKLLIGFGRDITGQAILAELNKMPHLLVAGSTGSGKSVCINGIIISILMRAKPHEVKLMLIDPKMVELNVYNGIPHLLAPVVTDAKKASQALQKVVSEMERRYDLFSHTGTRNIKGYNSFVERYNKENEDNMQKLPYIVVIIDELADLMMVASHDVEDSITRLAQMARAAGIHLIIATQRPSVDVITGVIKANIPSRIAFAVSSTVDSRTILDTGGAERLLGRGDMLFMPAGTSKPIRVQGAFVSDEEVQAVVDYVISQQQAQYDETMIPTEEPERHYEDETDALYDEAVQLVVEMQTASISMLQRRFRIGYSRAARIIDQMEARGVVGPADGSRPRQVLITSMQE